VPPLCFRYGAYHSKEEVAELVKPHPDTLKLVRAWLIHHGIRSSSISTTRGGSRLTVTDVLVPQANQLLGASYQLYRNTNTNDTIIRTVGYALPAVLHTRIQTVAPTTFFASKRGMRQTSRRRSFGSTPAPAASGKLVKPRAPLGPGGVTPSYLQLIYKTYAYTPSAADRNSLGILGIDDDYPSQVDLARFMARYRYEAEDADFSVVQLNGGGNDPNDPGDGASIGTQYAGAMAYPTPIIFFSIGGDTMWDENGNPILGDMYLAWFSDMLDQSVLPPTISISFGHPEQELPQEYAENLCQEFAELGLRGVSVLVASGQDGVGAGNCRDADGKVQLVPEFPSTCTCGVQ
jgi:tripeptidyl-peptidase-1